MNMLPAKIHIGMKPYYMSSIEAVGVHQIWEMVCSEACNKVCCGFLSSMSKIFLSLSVKSRVRQGCRASTPELVLSLRDNSGRVMPPCRWLAHRVMPPGSRLEKRERWDGFNFLPPRLSTVTRYKWPQAQPTRAAGSSNLGLKIAS